MATTLFAGRPSVLAAVCVPSALANAAQASVLGQPAVQIRVRTAPVFGELASRPGVSAGHLLAEGDALKINKYIGTIAAAAAERAAASVIPSSALWAQTADMVKGGDARGIPPRGTPV